MTAGEGEGWTADDLVAGSTDELVVADRGGARIVVLNRPAVRNAMSYAVRAAMIEALHEAEADATVVAVVITGAAGVFSSGVDLKDVRALRPGQPMVRPHPAEVVRSLTTPVIAAVDGYCVTGGLELALSCDFVVATERSSFADTHAHHGLFPGWGQTALLSGAIGTRRARQLLWTGEFVDAKTACRWGLVNELTTESGLLPRCLTLVEAMGRADRRSITLQREVLARSDGAPLDVALAHEHAAYHRYRAAAAPSSARGRERPGGEDGHFQA